MYCEWSTAWLGQPIVVKVWYYSDLFSRLTEELWISGLLVDRHKIRSWHPVFLCERLAVPISIADRVHYVEVSISYRYAKPCCNISIDGEIIGGDIDIKIPRTDLTTWPEIRRKGFCHFLVSTAYFNILRLARGCAVTIFYVPLMSVLCHFMGIVPFSWELTLSFFLQGSAIVLCGVVLGGPAISVSDWRMGEKLYTQALAHQRKLDAPPLCLEIGKHQVC